MYILLVADEEEGPPPGSDEEGAGMFDDFGEGKIGAKKLRKLQDKAEKKRQREVCCTASHTNPMIILLTHSALVTT